ncbi:hypothetical protein F443_14278 [Phytophthora nicotianae P1569]|uniref:Uncharacterized protein n=1 Tax=Phytophthora nicotianae P1569 TaxID=1317065 RepID=V9EM63_PHYNI|nr:hypothetical protein F443_14278 [Phytophthora nicotianae P1569]
MVVRPSGGSQGTKSKWSRRKCSEKNCCTHTYRWAARRRHSENYPRRLGLMGY